VSVSVWAFACMLGCLGVDGLFGCNLSCASEFCCTIARMGASVHQNKPVRSTQRGSLPFRRGVVCGSMKNRELGYNARMHDHHDLLFIPVAWILFLDSLLLDGHWT